MKKICVVFLLVLLFVGLLVSCKSTNHEVALSQNKGVVGKNGIARPDWVIYDQSNAINHYASGYGTGATFEVAKQKAQLNADAEIALWVSNSVTAIRDRYIEDTIVSETETYLDKFVSAASEVGQAILSGVTEIDYWEDNDGGVWVLRKIPVANVKAQIEAVIAATCADYSLFAEATDVAAVIAKFETVLNTYFPEQ